MAKDKPLPLTSEIIHIVKEEIVKRLRTAIGDNLKECVLYGSCARGDFGDDSDIDIALIVNCSRMEAKKYSQILVDIASEIAMKYYAIINFVCIPYEEYIGKKSWYSYFENISREGVVLYRQDHSRRLSLE